MKKRNLRIAVLKAEKPNIKVPTSREATLLPHVSVEGMVWERERRAQEREGGRLGL